MRFILVHGGFHGAWCWERLVPELEARGHQALAIDLPGHGARAAEDSTLANRRDAIIEVMQDGDVLVGHSGGGYDITLAADAAPDAVGHLIYLAAGLPIEGQPLVAASRGAGSGGEVEELNETIAPETLRADERGWLRMVDKEAARALFYHDCDEATVERAFARLSPAPPGILVDPVYLPNFWKAELPRSYLLSPEDRALPFATAMQFAGRLGVRPLWFEGSHSPFYSRPAQLAELMLKAVGTTPVAPLSPA